MNVAFFRFGTDAFNNVVSALICWMSKAAIGLYWRLKENTPAKDSIGCK